MKEAHLHCQKCGGLLDTEEDARTALCSRCRRRFARRVRLKEERSSLMDDFLDPVGLENLGD